MIAKIIQQKCCRRFFRWGAHHARFAEDAVFEDFIRGSALKLSYDLPLGVEWYRN